MMVHSKTKSLKYLDSIMMLKKTVFEADESTRRWIKY